MDVSGVRVMSGVMIPKFNDVFAYGRKYVIQSSPNLLIAPLTVRVSIRGGDIWQSHEDSQDILNLWESS